MADRNSDFAAAMVPVARAIWGEPNKALSKANELRYGSGGSRSVDVKKGTWFDHENGVGGGVIDLVKKEKGLQGREAIEWIEKAASVKLDDGRPKAQARAATRDETPPWDDGAPPHGEPVGDAPARQESGSKKIVATYDYTDAAGTLLYQVVRYEPKDFRQRRPDPDKPGQWIWNLKGIGHGLYRLPELREAIAGDETIFIAEGEKDVDNLIRVGISATTNSGGAKHWEVIAEAAAMFRDRNVVIAIDNDKPGRERGENVAKSLNGIAKSVRILDVAACVPDLVEKGDISDWIDQGATAEEIFAEVAKLKPWAPAPFVSKLGSRYVGDFATEAVKRDWIVKKALLARTLNLLIGAPGCGKSFLTLDLAMNLGHAAIDETHPKRWFRRRIKPCGVAYIAGEGQEDFIFRMRAWLLAKGLPLDVRMPVILIPIAVDLRSENARTNDLIEEIKARSEECLREFGVPIELLVIDTVSKALAGGDDVKPEHIGAFFRNCAAIRDACGTTTIAVHHTPKGGKLEARGHGSVTADNDGEWTVEAAEGPTPNNWRIKRIKAAATGDKHEFRLRTVKLGTDEDGDDITSLVVAEGGFEQSEESAIQQDTALAQKDGQANVLPDGRVILGDNLTAGVRALQKAIEAKLDAVRKLEDQARVAYQQDRDDEAKQLMSEAAAKTQGLFAPPDVRAPAGRPVATIAEWKAEISRAMVAEDKQSDAFRKRIERFLHQAGQRLVERRVIEIDGDYVWRTTRRVASVDRPETSGRDARASVRPTALSENRAFSSEDRAALSDPLAIPF